jgi:hypothetical protein
MTLDKGQVAIVTTDQHRPALQKQPNQLLTSANSLTNSNFQLLILDRGQVAIATKPAPTRTSKHKAISC